MLNGKIHYQLAIFNSYVTNYQRVYIVCHVIRRDFYKWAGTAGFSRGATWTLWRGGAEKTDVPWNSQQDEGTFIAMSFPYRMGVSYGSMGVMRVKQCHKPPMTGNGKHTISKHGDFPGGWFIYGIVFPTFYPLSIPPINVKSDEDDAFRSKNFKRLSSNIWALNLTRVRNAERNAENGTLNEKRERRSLSSWCLGIVPSE